jgi:hypothetical protein
MTSHPTAEIVIARSWSWDLEAGGARDSQMFQANFLDSMTSMENLSASITSGGDDTRPVSHFTVLRVGPASMTKTFFPR